jgi:hypothetical protein
MQEIIHQIIFYKIISVNLQFFDSIKNKRTQKQQLFFYLFCRKKYLKNPINQVKMFKFSKLLIRKDYDEHRRIEYKLTKLLKNKLDKYHKIIGNEGNEILRNFPNPFKVQK